MLSFSTRRAFPWTLTLGLFAAPAAAQSITTLVIEGDSIPGVGVVTSIANVAINNSADWMVETDTDNADTNLDGAIVRNGSLLYQEGQALLEPAGASLDFYDDMSINNFGNISNNFTLDGTATGADSGVYWNDSLILQEGDISTSPAFTPGTPYIGFFGTKINDANQVMVMASIDDPNITSTVDRALVVFDVDPLGNVLSETVFAKEGDTLPGISPELIEDFGTGPHEWAFAANGDIMFAVDTTGLTTADAAIYINTTMIAREGDPSPAAGRNWLTLTSPELDLSSNSAHYVYSGSLDGDSATNLVIIKDGAVFRQEGDTLPGIAPFTFTSFSSAPIHVSDNGDVVWYGDWNDTNLDIDTGLFLNDQLLVQEGVTMINGLLVDSFALTEGFALSDDGRYLHFEATLEGAINGSFLIDLQGGPEVVCLGDGTGATCPCGNTGAAGEGCANSNGFGAILTASGSTSIAAGDLVLSGSQLDPNQPGLYFQGDNALNGGLGFAFGDGLRCAGGNVVRIQTVQASAGGASSTSVNVAAEGGVAPGDVRTYQLWYRDPVTSPCGTTFNFTNGLRVTWDA